MAQDPMEKFASFEKYDFSSDEGWLKIEHSLEVPDNIPEERKLKVIKKKKARYYKASVDPELDLDAILLAASSQQQREQTSAPSAQPEEVNTSPEEKDSPKQQPPSSEPPEGAQPEVQPEQQPQPQEQSRLRGYSASRLYAIVLNYIKLIAYTFSMWNCVMFVLPQNNDTSRTRFTRALGSFALAHLLELLRAHPVFPFRQLKSGSYWRSLANDENGQLLLVNILLAFGNPFVFALGPGFARALLFCCDAYNVVLKEYLKPVHSIISVYLRKVSAKRGELYHTACLLEVVIGIYLIIALLTPSRNILVLIFYWQWLRVRYIQSYGVRTACTSMRVSMDVAFYHRMCPQLIRAGYLKVINFLYSFVDPVQMQQMAQQQRNSKCTIM